MTREEAKSCICTIEVLGRLFYRVHGVMDDVDAQNCKKLIEMLYGICDSESEVPSAQPEREKGEWIWCGDKHVCSECDEFALCDAYDVLETGEYQEKLSDFCPNCGADMR